MTITVELASEPINASSLYGQVQLMSLQLYTVGVGLDNAWLLTTAMGILLMQVGFLAVAVGSTKVKNVKSVVFKNLLQHSVASFAWYFCGFSVAYYHYSDWFGGVVATHGGFENAKALQQYGFCVTSCARVSPRAALSCS